MAHASFSIPKGICKNHLDLFKKENISINFLTDDKTIDIVEFTKSPEMDNAAFYDFIKKIKLIICEQDDLYAAAHGNGILWEFHK